MQTVTLATSVNVLPVYVKQLLAIVPVYARERHAAIACMHNILFWGQKHWHLQDEPSHSSHMNTYINILMCSVCIYSICSDSGTL